MATIAQSRRNNLWFGTEEKMGWLPTPNRGAQTGGTGWSAEGTTLNGGGFQLNSFGSHRQYIFEWPSTSSAKMAQLMKSYADGSFGRGLIYFLDPLIYMTNVLPAMWADPSMGIGQEGASLVYGVEASRLPTSGHEANSLPVASAYYDLTGVAAGWRGKEDAVFIPIPDGYTLSLGSIHSQSGQGRVMYRTQARNGGLGTVSEVTPLPTSTSTLVNTFISGPDVAGAWLFVGKAGSGAGSVTLTAMTGRLIPSAKAVVTPFATNYAPSLLGPTTPVEVRRNYFTQPLGSLSISRWNIRTVALTDQGAVTGGRAFIVDKLAIPATNFIAEQGSAYLPTFAAGVAFSSAVRVRNTSSVSLPFRMIMRRFGGSGGANSSGPTVIIPAGESAIVGHSYVTEVSQLVNASLAAGAGGIPLGSTFVIEDLWGLEVWPTPRLGFSGATSPDPDLIPSWVGTPNESESILTGLRPDGYTGTIYLHGDDVLRVPTGATGGLDGTGMGTLLLTAAGPQTVNGVPVPAGESRLVPATGIVLGPGDWSWLLLTPTPDYAGPWFDGDSGIFSIGAQLVKASWDGAPWESSATIYTTSVELEEVGLGPWIGGQGHSGCRFIGKPTEIKYGPLNGGQVGFAASFREVGHWIYG